MLKNIVLMGEIPKLTEECPLLSLLSLHYYHPNGSTQPHINYFSGATSVDLGRWIKAMKGDRILVVLLTLRLFLIWPQSISSPPLPHPVFALFLPLSTLFSLFHLPFASYRTYQHQSFLEGCWRVATCN